MLWSVLVSSLLKSKMFHALMYAFKDPIMKGYIYSSPNTNWGGNLYTCAPKETIKAHK